MWSQQLANVARLGSKKDSRLEHLYEDLSLADYPRLDWMRLSRTVDRRRHLGPILHLCRSNGENLPLVSIRKQKNPHGSIR